MSCRKKSTKISNSFMFFPFYSKSYVNSKVDNMKLLIHNDNETADTHKTIYRSPFLWWFCLLVMIIMSLEKRQPITMVYTFILQLFYHSNKTLCILHNFAYKLTVTVLCAVVPSNKTVIIKYDLQYK